MTNEEAVWAQSMAVLSVQFSLIRSLIKSAPTAEKAIELRRQLVQDAQELGQKFASSAPDSLSRARMQTQVSHLIENWFASVEVKGPARQH